MTILDSLRAADGHQFSAVCCMPSELEPMGGIVLLQEIFGLTPQLRTMASRFAELGYRVVVPALYDRVQPDLVLDYSEVEQAREAVSRLVWEQTHLDIATAADFARCGGGVALVGYCWGGGVVYRAACQLDVDCAVSFYGTRLPSYLDEKPRCPVQFHFGGLDQHVSPQEVEIVREAISGREMYIYEQAGHAFANESRPSFHRTSRDLAELRMFEFIESELAYGE